jgi:hypothetical protein
MKDPAMLWYWNDWYSGTGLLSRFLKGCYMDLLHAQFNNGRLSLEEIKVCLGADFGSSWPTLQKKFKQDENGLFFNERLENEKEKRKAFSQSRRDNVNKRYEKPTHVDTYVGHMNNHMENTNRNENRNGNTPLDKHDFLNNQKWKEQFCMAKNLSMEDLESLQEEVLTNIELSGKKIDSYKGYFLNWYNLKKPVPKSKIRNPKLDNL